MNLSSKPINQVLADNLRYYMERRGIETQSALARRSGVAQRTVCNYLRPVLRLETKDGKEPSAKLTEISKLASALSVEVWQLLRDMTPEEQAAYSRIEEAVKVLSHH